MRRSVIVLDAGEPRNAPASHKHSYLGHESLPPAELVAIARAEVRNYGVEVLAGRTIDVSRLDHERFRVELEDGRAVVAGRVLAATGLVDELPDIDGLREHWGADAIHRPFCHGFEVRDRRIVQVVTLGLRPSPHPTGLGDFIPTDETGATAVPGIYAAGNLTDPSQQVLVAAADGSRVGGMISFSLAHEDESPRTPDGRGVRNLLGAVASGGTLLVVNHAIGPDHNPFFDLGALVQIEEVVQVLNESAD